MNRHAPAGHRKKTMTTTALLRSLFLSAAALLVLLLHCTEVSAHDSVDNVDESISAALFLPQESIQVVGPSVFPKPTRLYPENEQVIPIAKPIIGQHRPDQDAVFAYAEGYVVGHYMLFLNTLRDTGFDGDVVLAIADEPQENVVEYLQQQPHVVIYKASLKCFGEDRVTPVPRTIKQQSLDVFQMCSLKDVYGFQNGTALPDAREGRVVATLRYEWYWIWSLQYNADQWLLLLDARDSIFQVNPFPQSLPRTKEKGILYLFGENAEVTRLGRSRHNSNWLRNAYGQYVIDALSEKPTLCSGSSMGNQRAIETYLRAMVNEWDETNIAMTGSDQGFHNYLYYSGKLQNANNISQVIVWEQGKGIVNNLGALRTKPLSEWGIYNNVTHAIFNWDQTLSPVAHQWDRDQHMFRYTQHQRMKKMVQQWKQEQKKRNKE